MATVSWKIGASSRFLFYSLAHNGKYNNVLRRVCCTPLSSGNRSSHFLFSPLLARQYVSSTTNKSEEKNAILKQLEEEHAQSEEQARIRRERQWKHTKTGLAFCGVLMIGVAGFTIAELGSPKLDEAGNIVKDEFSHLALPLQYMGRTWKELGYFKKWIGDPSREKLLPDPLTYPYIQPPYTLVLEFTDLLVHPDWTYQTGWRFKKRPGVDYFLEQVAPPLFEVVVYTAEQGMTVFPILDALDPKGFIMYRLVRDATSYENGVHVKALDHLNRDLSKIIVVDWNSDSVKNHPRNALLIPKWSGNDNDTTLIDLAAFLKMLAVNSVDDVRDVLDYYQQFDDPLRAFRENQRKLLDQLEQSEKDRKESPQGLAQRWKPSLLQKPKY